MPIQLSNRVGKVSPSQTLSIGTLTARIQESGKNVINLATGQPDFDTPDHIKKAAIKAIRDGYTKYTSVGGSLLLRQAIVDKMKRENALDYDAEKQILVSCGAKHSLYNLCQALLDVGDEVIIPKPYWVSYPEMVKLAGGKPVFTDIGNQPELKLNAAELRRCITKNTKMLILNSPNNPSGGVYDEEELRSLSEVLLEHPPITIVSDDIYEHILFGNRTFKNIINVCPDLYERSIIVNGVSKAYSMTGWRIGYTCTSAEVNNAMKKIQSHSTSNPASISQEAAREALSGSQDFVKESNQIFEQHHDYAYKQLCATEGIECLPSAGSFYLFADFSKVIESLPNVSNDLELAEYFLKEVHVATVPGIAFGMSGYLRISFSTTLDNMKTGIARIRDAIKC